MLYSKLTTLPLLVLCGAVSCNGAFADEEATEKSVTQKVEVQVQSSTTKHAGDEEAQAVVSGRIVIVGPDGERKEYNLDDKLPGDLKLNLDGIANGVMISRGKATQDNQKSRYMIGVVCESADKVLRSHLKLGGVGLVVKRLSDEMPAARAGLKEGDILTGVGDKDLSELKDLVSAVAESNGASLTFRRIHDGEASEIVMTPVKSNAAALSDTLNSNVGVEQFAEVLRSLDQPNAQLEMLKKLAVGNNGVMIQSFGPGIELDDAEDFEQKFGEILSNARKMATKSAARRRVVEISGSNQAGLEELKQQIEKNRAELIELREKLKSSQSGD